LQRLPLLFAIFASTQQYFAQFGNDFDRIAIDISAKLINEFKISACESGS